MGGMIGIGRKGLNEAMAGGMTAVQLEQQRESANEAIKTAERNQSVSMAGSAAGIGAYVGPKVFSGGGAAIPAHPEGAYMLSEFGGQGVSVAQATGQSTGLSAGGLSSTTAMETVGASAPSLMGGTGAAELGAISVEAGGAAIGSGTAGAAGAGGVGAAGAGAAGAGAAGAGAGGAGMMASLGAAGPIGLGVLGAAAVGYLLGEIL